MLIATLKIASAQENPKHTLYEKVYAEIIDNGRVDPDLESDRSKTDFLRLGKMWLKELRTYCKTDIFDKASSWKCAKPNKTLLGFYFDSEEHLKEAIRALQSLPMGCRDGGTVVIPRNGKISNPSVLIQYNQHELLILSTLDGGSPNTKDAIVQKFQNVQGTGVNDPNKKY